MSAYSNMFRSIDKSNKSEENIDNRASINLDDCKKTEEEAKQLIKKTKYVYVCPICNKIMSQRGQLRYHLSGKYLCSEIRSISYLRKQIRENQSITAMTENLDQLIDTFYLYAGQATDIRYVAACRKLLRKIKYRFRAIVCDVRIISIHDYNDVHKYDDELNKYAELISDIEKKYLLLIV